MKIVDFWGDFLAAETHLAVSFVRVLRRSGFALCVCLYAVSSYNQCSTHPDQQQYPDRLRLLPVRAHEIKMNLAYWHEDTNVPSMDDVSSSINHDHNLDALIRVVIEKRITQHQIRYALRHPARAFRRRNLHSENNQILSSWRS